MPGVNTGECVAGVRPDEWDMRDGIVPPPFQALLLPGRVGYLGVSYFWPMADAARRLSDAMEMLVSAEALIIDLRRNAGGDRATAALLASLLFDTESVCLAETRSVPASGFAPAVPTVRYLDHPVIVLVGRRTSVEGWRFARNLRALDRVVIAGELPAVAHGDADARVDVPVPAGSALKRSHDKLATQAR